MLLLLLLSCAAAANSSWCELDTEPHFRQAELDGQRVFKGDLYTNVFTSSNSVELLTIKHLQQSRNGSMLGCLVKASPCLAAFPWSSM